MIHFVAPPGWPSGPAGWLPPVDWTPGSGLPKPPRGWVFYVDDYGMPADPGPYHWDPETWAPENAYGTEKDVATESFPTYRPPRHRSSSAATVPEPGRLTRRRHPVRTLLVLAAVALVVVAVIRPDLVDRLKDAVISHDPSVSEPAPADGFTPLPEPDDLPAAAMVALGHRCITEAVEPHLIGCTPSGGDIEVSARWVLDADDEIITFQVVGRATGHGGQVSTSVAALLQLATGDPQVDIITALPELGEGDEQDFELDWGRVHIVDLGGDGLQLVRGMRADGPPPSMTPQQFAVSASEATTVLPADGDFECSGKNARLSCTRGDGEIAILSDDDTITTVLIGIDHIDDTKGPLLNLILAQDDIQPVIDAVLEVADNARGTVVSVAGFLVERVDDQVRVVPILPWW